MLDKKTLIEKRMALAIEEAYAENEIRHAVTEYLIANPVIYKNCKLLPRMEESDRDDLEIKVDDMDVQIHFEGISKSKMEVRCPDIDICFQVNQLPVKVKILYTALNGKHKQKVFS